MPWCYPSLSSEVTCIELQPLCMAVESVEVATEWLQPQLPQCTTNGTTVCNGFDECFVCPFTSGHLAARTGFEPATPCLKGKCVYRSTTGPRNRTVPTTGSNVNHDHMPTVAHVTTFNVLPAGTVDRHPVLVALLSFTVRCQRAVPKRILLTPHGRRSVKIRIMSMTSSGGAC